jgi:hypothetical protein
MRFVVLACLAVLLSGCGGGAIERLNPAPTSEAQYRLGGCQLRGHGVCKDMQEFSGQSAQTGAVAN